MQLIIFFCVAFFLWGSFIPGPVSAQTSSELARYLAALHTREQKRSESFLGRNPQPPQALVSEFQWFLDGLQNRCINPLDSITTTIFETWGKLRQVKTDASLLDTARGLYGAARNTRLFGSERVNFIMTSEFWLISQLSGNTIEDVVASYLASKKQE